MQVKYHSTLNIAGAQKYLLNKWKNVCSKMRAGINSERGERRAFQTKFTSLSFPSPDPAEVCRAMGINIRGCGISFCKTFKNDMDSYISGKVPTKTRRMIWIIWIDSGSFFLGLWFVFVFQFQEIQCKIIYCHPYYHANNNNNLLSLLYARQFAECGISTNELSNFC